jgi:hypothetical protein
MVNGEYMDVEDWMDAVSMLTLDMEDVVVGPVDVTLVVLFDAERLCIDGDDRIDGVSNDSRALGSSNFVYLPIEGLCITYANPHANEHILSYNSHKSDNKPDASQSSCPAHP